MMHKLGSRVGIRGGGGSFAFILLVALTLGGCEHENSAPAAGQPLSESGGTIYQPNGIIEGCRLYYVNPRYGNTFQLAICDQKSTSPTTFWDEYCGKGCIRHESIQTLMVNRG